MKAILRGHHLICLNFYKGEGYSESFIKKLNIIVQRAKDEGILIKEGADDVCMACPYLSIDRCYLNERAEQEIRAIDDLALRLLGFTVGMEISWQDISSRLPLILDHWQKESCISCQWKEVCYIDEAF